MHVTYQSQIAKSTSPCINLLCRFGKRYKITWDPCFNPKGKHRESLDPWMMQIPCQRGTIYPPGGTLLAVEVDGRPITANKLFNIDCCQLYQDGDHEKTFLFDVADFETVAEIMKPRRKRQLSDVERQKLREVGANTRFQTRLLERSREGLAASETVGR